MILLSLINVCQTENSLRDLYSKAEFVRGRDIIIHGIKTAKRYRNPWCSACCLPAGALYTSWAGSNFRPRWYKVIQLVFIAEYVCIAVALGSPTVPQGTHYPTSRVLAYLENHSYPCCPSFVLLPHPHTKLWFKIVVLFKDFILKSKINFK